jgi:hypothetical protein
MDLLAGSADRPAALIGAYRIAVGGSSSCVFGTGDVMVA